MPQSVKIQVRPWLHTGSRMHACTSGHSLLTQRRQSTGPPEPDDVALTLVVALPLVTPDDACALDDAEPALALDDPLAGPVLDDPTAGPVPANVDPPAPSPMSSGSWSTVRLHPTATDRATNSAEKERFMAPPGQEQVASYYRADGAASRFHRRTARPSVAQAVVP